MIPGPVQVRVPPVGVGPLGPATPTPCTGQAPVEGPVPAACITAPAAGPPPPVHASSFAFQREVRVLGVPVVSVGVNARACVLLRPLLGGWVTNRAAALSARRCCRLFCFAANCGSVYHIVGVLRDRRAAACGGRTATAFG